MPFIGPFTLRIHARALLKEQTHHHREDLIDVSQWFLFSRNGSVPPKKIALHSPTNRDYSVAAPPNKYYSEEVSTKGEKT